MVMVRTVQVGKRYQWFQSTQSGMVAGALALLLGLGGCGGTVEESTDGAGGNDGTNGGDGDGTHGDDTNGSSTDGTADVPNECVGSYDGNFTGDVRGKLTGNLNANADFEVTFTQADTGLSATGSGSVAEDGKIEVILGPNRVTGRFNFDRCRAKGDWVTGEAVGSWNAVRR